MSSKNPCSCIRSTFALQFNAVSKDILLVYDLSDWVTDQGGFVYPDFYLLEVENPEGTKVSVEINPRNGSALSKSTFPDGWVDGLYTFRADICGKVYSIKHLIMPSIRCSLDKAILAGEKTDYELIRQIEMDYRVAEAAASVGNFLEATTLLKLIKNKIARLTCDCKCN